MLIERLASLREDWPDALRIVISMVLAAAVSTLLHLAFDEFRTAPVAAVPRPVDALDFLLETFGKDLHDLIRVLQAPRQG
jgi:hypothetical protein